jgi:hypothetical protein
MFVFGRLGERTVLVTIVPENSLRSSMYLCINNALTLSFYWTVGYIHKAVTMVPDNSLRQSA